MYPSRLPAFLFPLLLLVPATALADGAARDRPEPQPESEPAIAPRPWLFLDDPTPARAMTATAFSRATYTGAGATPTRPFGGDLAHPGGVLELGGEAGLTRWMSVTASGFASSLSPGESGSLGAIAGVRLAPFAWRTTHLATSFGWLRELAGHDGGWARVSIAQDLGRLRLGTTVHGEHVFAQGRDGVDVMVMAGASYAVASGLRLGAEYVAQDLEGAVDPGEVEGVRHFAGPTAGLELAGRRLSITGGPAFGLSRNSPAVVGRAGIAYAF